MGLLNEEEDAPENGVFPDIGCCEQNPSGYSESAGQDFGAWLLSLGRVSSVNIASLNEACVSVTTPSTGICSPGKTIKYSLVKPDQS